MVRELYSKMKTNIFDKEGKLIAIATMHNGLYQVDCNALIDQNKVFVAKNTIGLWHRRLGHICDKNLVEVKKSCNGIDFVNENYDRCIVCIKGKQTRKPNKDDGTRTTKLELIHSDVLGPMKKNHFQELVTWSLLSTTFQESCLYPLFKTSQMCLRLSPISKQWSKIKPRKRLKSLDLGH